MIDQIFQKYTPKIQPLCFDDESLTINIKQLAIISKLKAKTLKRDLTILRYFIQRLMTA